MTCCSVTNTSYTDNYQIDALLIVGASWSTHHHLDISSHIVDYTLQHNLFKESNMRPNRRHVLAAGLILLVVVGCETTVQTNGDADNQRLADEMLANIDKISNELSMIQDVDSAKAAAPKLENLFNRMQQLVERSELLPKPSAELDRRLTEKMKAKHAEFSQTMQKFVNSMITNPAIVPIMQPLLEKMRTIGGGS